MRGILPAWALLALLAAAAPARAQSTARDEVEQHLYEARRLYTELDFVGAVETLGRALAVPGISDAQRLVALELSGASFVVLDRDEDAARAFDAMLDLDPYHVVREPSGSPKIARFVEARRAARVSDAALDPEVVLSVDLPRAGRIERPTPLEVRVDGPPGRVASVSLYLRGVGERRWEEVPARAAGAGFEVEVPARPSPDELELYLQARDPHGRVVARAGEPLLPLALSISVSGPPTRVTRQWWFWTLVGAAAVGLAAGVGVAARDRQGAEGGTLPPGRVVLPLGAR